MISTQQLHMCDVCRLLDYDTALKPCNYCGLCDAWICPEDSNWLKPKVGARRLLAAAKRKLEPGYHGVQNYDELAVPDKEQRDKFKGELT